MSARETVCDLNGRLRTRGRPRRMFFMCMKLALATVAVAAVAVGILVARIAAAPISIDGLGRTITRSLQDRFGNDLRFSIGSTTIVQRGFGTTLAVDRLEVTWANGQDVLVAPRGELAISTLALMFGKIVPKRLDVFDVTLRAMFLKNGNLALAAGNGSRPFFELGHDETQPQADTGKVDPNAPPQTIMHQAGQMLRQIADVLTNPDGPIAAVDRLGISHGTLVIKDQETNVETSYRGLDLEFGHDGSARTLSVSAEGPNGRWSINASASGRPKAERQFALKVQNLTIDELKIAAGSRSKGIDTDAPVNMHLGLKLAANNRLLNASGGVALGRGFVKTDDPDFEPLFVDAISTDFHWNAETRRLVVDDLTYQEGDTHFNGSGEVRTPLHAADPWQIALRLAKPGMLAPDRKGQLPIKVVGGEFRGEFLPDRKLFIIQRMTLRPELGGFALAGSVEWQHGPHLRLGISMDPTPVQVIERIWPSPMAAAVRAWALNHFEAGTVSDGVLKIDYDDLDLQRMRADVAPADPSVSIDFKVTGGRIRYLDGVPPLENVEGRAHISGRSTTITVNSATTLSDGKTIQLTDGSFVVPNSSVHPVEARVKAHLVGRVEAVTAILARDALKPYASLPLDPATLHGDISGELSKGLLLGAGPADPTKETLNVAAKIANFQADKLIGKESLTDANLDLAVDSGSFQAKGQGKLFGGPATFSIARAGSAAPHAEIDLVLDDAARAKSGMSAVPGVTGPITAHVAADLGGDASQMKANINLDLSKTAIAAAYLGVNKPAGRPGHVALTLTSGPDHMNIDPLQIELGSLQAKGSVELAGDNSFRSAHFGTFKVSAGDDMKVDVSNDNGIFRVNVRGGAVDARPFLKAVTSIPTNEATPLSKSAKAEKTEADSFKGFDIDLKTSLLSGFNKEVLSGVDLKLSRRGSTMSGFNVHGRFGRSELLGSMTGNSIIRINAQDAGALVSFIDLYKHMEGGALAASFHMGDETLRGNLEIHDFILRNEPAIERLVATSTTLAPPGQGADAVRRIDGGAVVFNRLKVNFERDGSHLQLSDATMHGPDLGLSVDGWLDYSHDGVGMKGTFVPAYAVNNLFSQVPVLGVFLGGKSNEGLLAITFNISGRASQPTLTINPLSVIAPGILRNIFGVFDAPPPKFSSESETHSTQ